MSKPIRGQACPLKCLAAASVLLLSPVTYAEETTVDISLESTFVGDAKAQPASSHFVSWENSPSPDGLKWNIEQKKGDDTLSVIDKNEMRRSLDIYGNLNMEDIGQR